MKTRMLRFALSAAILAAVPARMALAEDNRLLPFWGQPYPSGYAWGDDGIDRSRFAPCRPERRSARTGRRETSDIRCRVVLHARD